MSSFASALINNENNAANRVINENGAVLCDTSNHPGVDAFNKIVRDTGISYKTGKKRCEEQYETEKIQRRMQARLRRRNGAKSKDTESEQPIKTTEQSQTNKKEKMVFKMETQTGRESVQRYIDAMITAAHGNNDVQLVKDAFLLAAHKRAINMNAAKKVHDKPEMKKKQAVMRGGRRQRTTSTVRKSVNQNKAGGEGERTIWSQIMLSLYRHYPETVCNILETVPSYGCWRDMYMLWALVEFRGEFNQYRGLIQAIIRTIYNQLARDFSHEQAPSLLVKWFARESGHYSADCKYYMPSGEVLSSYQVFAILMHKCYFAKRPLPSDIESAGGLNAYGTPLPVKEMNYAKMRLRKELSALNKAMNTFETLTCSGNWSKIDPAKVPSRCFMLQTSALLNEERGAAQLTGNQNMTGNRYPENEDRVKARQNTLNMLLDPSKIKVAGVDPHEILNAFSAAGSSATRQVAEAQWSAKVDEVFNQMQVVQQELGCEMPALIGMSDVSGSMSGTPMDVSIAMGVLLSYIHEKSGRDPVAVSFTETPMAFDFKGKTLAERVSLIKRHVGYGTNFESALYMVLDAIKSSGKNHDLIVFTDGQFNEFDKQSAKHWDTCHQKFLQAVAERGLDRAPRVIYWNLRADTPGVQTTASMPGVQFLQGYSSALLRFVLYGEKMPDTVVKVVTADGTERTVKVKSVTPYDTYRTALDVDRYDCVRTVLANSSEGLFGSSSAK